MKIDNKRRLLKVKKKQFSISFLLVAFILLTASCGSTREKGRQVNDFEDLQQLVESGNFKIENQWAIPLGGNQINLTTNINYIKFKGDSVELFLPYFGVRHAGGGYGRSGGMEINDLVENLEISENPSKETITVEFEGNQNNENLEFFIQLFANGNTSTSVNSSERSTISYRGHLSALDEDDK
jgi:hypothetical protein